MLSNSLECIIQAVNCTSKTIHSCRCCLDMDQKDFVVDQTSVFEWRICPSLLTTKFTPHPSSTNEEAPSPVPFNHPARLPFVSAVGGGLESVIGHACSGESRPLVWGHKTVSLCLSAVPQGQKDMPCWGTHTHTDTHAHTHVPSSSSHHQLLQLPGKNNYLLLFLSSGFRRTQMSGLRGKKDRWRFVPPSHFYVRFILPLF